MMESLLCNEVWLMMSPVLDHDEVHANEALEYCNVNCGYHSTSTTSLYSNSEDCQRAFISFLEKEAFYMPERGYLKLVKENCSTDSGRFKAIHWFVESQRRLNLSLETVFRAANYLDRFGSLKDCQVRNDWMFELVSVACLSIAFKFETNAPNVLNEIQTEGLEHSFESSLIQRMELILLKALEWRLCPTTSYSYLELLTRSIDPLNRHFVQELITELLVKALLDSSFSEFRPCIIALSAIQRISKEFLSTINDSLCSHFSVLIPPDQKDDLIKCCKMMMDLCHTSTSAKKISCINCPSSPVTVLGTHSCCDFCDCQIDHSLLLTINSPDINYFGGSTKKRKREQEEGGV
ncbi:putative cyclin-D7-1 isoform X1 [Coffea arabica]